MPHGGPDVQVVVVPERERQLVVPAEQPAEAGAARPELLTILGLAVAGYAAWLLLQEQGGMPLIPPGDGEPPPPGGGPQPPRPEPQPVGVPRYDFATCRVLRMGSSGNDVRALQHALTFLGHDPRGIDGIFGPRTQAALMSFQRAAGITVDGIAGPETYRALDRALRPRGGYFVCRNYGMFPPVPSYQA